MLVMILEKAPASLKGALSRWLTEPKSGVFLGSPSARVRDELWKMAEERIKDGSIMQVWNTRSPQGFQFRCHGDLKRELVDMEGIALVRARPRKEGKKGTKQTGREPEDDSGPNEN